MEMVALTPVSRTRSLWEMALSRRPYYFISGLLYPAVLGAALIWFVQGVAAYFTGSASRPSAWGLFFALWFAIYHSLLYVRLIDLHGEWASDPTGHPAGAYHIASLSSDIVDSIALFNGPGLHNHWRRSCIEFFSPARRKLDMERSSTRLLVGAPGYLFSRTVSSCVTRA